MALELGSCPMHNGIFGMGYGIITQIVIFALFFLIVWWLIKKNPQSQEKAIDILKKRLAAGEITKKQFEQLKKEIE